MLPTFVIGLREGLEASLIVGILAAFLRQRGRQDLLRWVFVGIFAAIALCTAAGVALDLLSRNLPQREQEGLETVIGFVAVAMVTYMVVWMKRHSRELKGQLDRAAGVALAAGSGVALVAMAFLAVLREGLETVVFLLAAFNESGSGFSAGAGAVLGILTAVALGYAIYRGGVRLNLSKFFRATGVVLVLVAAGLVVNALHTAHEAGWLTVGQQQTFDLSTIVRPGSVQSSLLTGMLGLQSKPVLIEIIGWLLYLIPVGLYVAWPPGKGPSRTTFRRLSLAGGSVFALAAVTLVVVTPDRPTENPLTRSGAISAQVVTRSPNQLVVETVAQHPLQARADAGPARMTARHVSTWTYRGVLTDVYRATLTGPAPGPPTMTLVRLSQLGGGRLPLGVIGSDGKPLDGRNDVPVTRESTTDATFWVAHDTGRIVNARWDERITLLADFSIGETPVGEPTRASVQLSTAALGVAAAAARRDSSDLDNRNLLTNLAVVAMVAAVVLLGIALALAAQASRVRRRTEPQQAAPHQDFATPLDRLG